MIYDEKHKLRKKMISLLKNERQLQLKDFNFHDAKLLLAYIPLKTEVDITPLIDSALSQNIEVAIPTSDPLFFVQLSDNWKEELITLPNKTQSVDFGKIIDIRNINRKTIVLVPGLAFTKDGKRLGRGLGFYDRVLAQVENNINVTSVGVCTKKQLVQTIPTADNDKKVSKLSII